MSGVSVIRYLLAQNSGLTAVVSASKIKAGDLPLNIALPAIGVKQISSSARLTVSMNSPKTLHTVRVQVSAMVKESIANPQGDGYPGLESIMKLILAACPNQHGTVNSISVDSILPDLEGPDLPGDETGVISRSRDFIVSYSE